MVLTRSPIKQFANKHFFHGSFLPGPSTCFRKTETRTENYPENTSLKPKNYNISPYTCFQYREKHSTIPKLYFETRVITIVNLF